MKSTKTPKRKAYASIHIPFQGNEFEDFERYLEIRGAKKGAFVRQLLIREMAKEVPS
jgi:hypothetical protein